MMYGSATQHSHDNTYNIHHITYNTQRTTHTRTHLVFQLRCVLMTHVKLAIAVGGESREGAVETAATYKEGSRRANCFDTGRLLCVFLHSVWSAGGGWCVYRFEIVFSSDRFVLNTLLRGELAGAAHLSILMALVS